jgi:hypothetical protein
MYLIKWLKKLFGEGLRDGACIPGLNDKGEPINVFGFHLLAEGEWIYINPPFDTPTIVKFAEAARLRADEGTTVVMLLPNKLCQVGFVNGVNLHFDEVWTLGGRINFESPYSTKGGSSMNGCFFGILRPERIEPSILKHFTLSQIKRWDYDV